MSELDRELAKVRAKRDAAMAGQSAQGSTQRGVLEAGVRASLDHAIGELDPSLADLEQSLGEKLDGGSFLMGMQAAGMALMGVNANKAVSMMPDLFREYVAKARQR